MNFILFQRDALISPTFAISKAEAKAEVHRRGPETLEELRDVVEEVVDAISTKEIRRAVKNIHKRANLCVNKKGGHFQGKM